jgi:hypothetical protein
MLKYESIRVARLTDTAMRGYPEEFRAGDEP